MYTHECNAPNEARDGMYGIAIDKCWESDDGILWVDNDEYCSQVNYCPYCGYQAKIKIEKK